MRKKSWKVHRVPAGDTTMCRTQIYLHNWTSPRETLNVSNQSNPFSAGASALGYLYGCRPALWFALLRLREREDTDVAIESLDDVTFSNDGKPTELLQTKHHLNAKATLANTSPDLWKTLRIWASQVSLIRDGLPAML